MKTLACLSISSTTSRRRNGIVVILVAILALSGCATARQTWVDLLDEQEKTVAVQVAKIPVICRVAQWDAGWIEGTRVLSPEEMTQASAKALVELETLCAKPESLTYKEMGKVSAIAFRLWVDRAMAAFSKYGGSALMKGITF